MGDLDSAVSRLYYAMFHCAQVLLDAKGLRFRNHRGVIAGFSEHFVKTGDLPVSMGRALRAAYDQRAIGDYDAMSHVTPDTVDNVLAKARDFLENTKSYLAGHTPLREPPGR
jgi:uncharacterized protein (UPF0332 family)